MKFFTGAESLVMRFWGGSNRLLRNRNPVAEQGGIRLRFNAVRRLKNVFHQPAGILPALAVVPFLIFCSCAGLPSETERTEAGSIVSESEHLEEGQGGDDASLETAAEEASEPPEEQSPGKTAASKPALPSFSQKKRSQATEVLQEAASNEPPVDKSSSETHPNPLLTPDVELTADPPGSVDESLAAFGVPAGINGEDTGEDTNFDTPSVSESDEAPPSVKPEDNQNSATGSETSPPAVTNPVQTSPAVSEPADAATRSPEFVSEPGETSARPVPNLVQSSPEGPRRLLNAPGPIGIVLEGRGWIFRSDLSTPEGWSFTDRTIAGDSTQFHFNFDETGRWDLVFERQDLTNGGREQENRRIIVGPSGSNAPDSQTAAFSSAAGQNPDSRHRAALSAIAGGRLEEALALWAEDASLPGPRGQRARARLMQHAAEAGHIGIILPYIPKYLTEDPSPDILAALLDAFETQAGYSPQRRLILETLQPLNTPGQARWTYQLARSLEIPGETRNLDRAAALYSLIINRWPLSEWCFSAEERLDRLERHYFRIP